METSTEPPNEAICETANAQVIATESVRGRPADPDAQSLVKSIARLEAAMRKNPQAGLSAALFGKLVDLRATIEQVAALLAANGPAASDDLFAAERLQAIAMAIRRRGVEPTLCEALEDAARNIGDTIVRNDAAAARTQSAEVLLKDAARGVNDLIALVAQLTAAPTEERGMQLADRAADRRGNEGATARNPLAGVLALCEEELIALFS
mgnify:CR=1 FL=1